MHSPERDIDPKNGIVRHFDRSGHLIGSFVPRNSLDDPAVRPLESFLAASHDRVGWFSTGKLVPGQKRPGSYMEFTADGTIKEYPLPSERDAEPGIYGFALTDDGSAFANVAVHDTLVMMNLDREQRVWKPVSVPGFADMTQTWLLGGTGNTLALWDTGTGVVHLFDLKK